MAASHSAIVDRGRRRHEVSVEDRVVHWPNTYRWWHGWVVLRAQPLPNENGAVIGMHDLGVFDAPTGSIRLGAGLLGMRQQAVSVELKDSAVGRVANAMGVHLVARLGQ